MAIFHSENFNNGGSVNTLLWNKVPQVGGQWFAYNYVSGSDISACHVAASIADARFRGYSTAASPCYVVSRDSDSDQDLRVSCQIGFTHATSGYAGVLFKATTATNTYYTVDVTSTVCSLRRVVAGVSTTLAQAEWLRDGTRELKVEFIKATNKLIVYRQGVKLFEYTDATPITGTGKVGIVGQGTGTTAVWFDNFRAEDFDSTKQNIFVLDRFETKERALLESHLSNIGGAWIRLEGASNTYAAGDIWSTAWVRGMAYQNAGSTTSYYLPVMEPVTVKGVRYTCDVGIYDVPTTAAAGLLLRINPDTRALYRCYGLNGQFYVVKNTSASSATIIAQTAYAYGATQTLKKLEIELRPVGGTLRIVVIDNGTPIIDIIDSTPLARGYAGVLGTTGGIWDNIQGEEIFEDSTIGALNATGSGVFNAAGVGVVVKPTTFTANGGSTMAYQAMWLATGYLNADSSGTLTAKSVPFITRSANLTSANQGTITARGRSTARSSATFENSQSVFSPISNSLIEGEGIFTAAGSGAATFASSVYNGSKLTAGGTSPVLFRGQRLGNAFTAGGTSTATFWQFGRVNAGTLTAAGTSQAAFLPFGRVNAGKLTAVGKATSTFGDIIKARLSTAGTGVASFQGRPHGTGKLTSFNSPRPVDFTSTGLTKTDFALSGNSTTLFRGPGLGIRFHAYIIG